MAELLEPMKAESGRLSKGLVIGAVATIVCSVLVASVTAYYDRRTKQHEFMETQRILELKDFTKLIGTAEELENEYNDEKVDLKRAIDSPSKENVDSAIQKLTSTHEKVMGLMINFHTHRVLINALFDYEIKPSPMELQNERTTSADASMATSEYLKQTLTSIDAQVKQLDGFVKTLEGVADDCSKYIRE